MFDYLKTISDMAMRFPFWRPVIPLHSFEQLDYSPFSTKRLRLNKEIEVAYIDEGHGAEVILMLHGMGNSLTAFRNIIPLLSKKYRCIAIDLPGFGKSVRSPIEGTMHGYAGVIDGFMQKMGIVEANILGHSMGGQIACWLAINYPERVKRLLLVASAGFESFTSDERQWLLNSMTSLGTQMAAPQQIWSSVQANFYKMPPEAWFLYTDRLAIQTAPDFITYCEMIPRCMSGMIDEEVLPHAHKIKAPVLLVFGENDALIPNPILHGHWNTQALAEKASRQIPNARLIWIPNCGHFVPLERPEELSNLLTEFIE